MHIQSACRTAQCKCTRVCTHVSIPLENFHICAFCQYIFGWKMGILRQEEVKGTAYYVFIFHVVFFLLLLFHSVPLLSTSLHSISTFIHSGRVKINYMKSLCECESSTLRSETDIPIFPYPLNVPNILTFSPVGRRTIQWTVDGISLRFKECILQALHREF